jgi:copper homeostasis protein
MPILLEVALATLDDARTASESGADRIELNAALELGGLTPSLATLITIRQSVPLPVIVMIRPRPGGFVYTDAEFLTMRRDADLALEHGADGLAFGILRPDRTIDRPRCEILLCQMGGRPAVFHRAFDLTPDPFDALSCLSDLGLTRILTAGQQPDAMAGVAMLRQLVERAAGRIQILPGGGVTPDNAPALIALTGVNQLHGSFSTPDRDPAEPVCQGAYRRTSAEKIRKTRAALSRL